MYLYAIVQYLPKEHSERESWTVLNGSFSGGGSGTTTAKNAFITDCFFKALDYFKTPSELLQSFIWWMNREGETGAYNQQNRLYGARYKYKFFKVDYDYLEETWDSEPLKGGRGDYLVSLDKYDEITESDFIKDMNESEAMRAVAKYCVPQTILHRRAPESRTGQFDTRVSVVYNDDSWCYRDSLLNGMPDGAKTQILHISVELPLNEVNDVISKTLGKVYNFALQE